MITATRQNWKAIGIKIHEWFMQDMGISIGTTPERVFLGLALAGEAGELANKIKKLWRDQKKMSHDEVVALQQEIYMEIADVNGYLNHLVHSFGISLTDVTVEKTNELITRWPQIFGDPS